MWMLTMMTPKVFYPPKIPDDDAEMLALKKDFNTRARLIRNKTRGKIGEIMATTMIDREVRDDVVIDKRCFKTDYGLRRIDCFYPHNLTAIESKNCYVYASPFVRCQIKKDGYLLRNGICREIVWAVYNKISANARQLLLENNITVRVGWDEIVPPR
jgi:hypothetical protein